jgi:hypothetical protein
MAKVPCHIENGNIGTDPSQMYAWDGTKPVRVNADLTAGYIFYQYEEAALYLYVASESPDGAWIIKRLTNSTGKMEYAVGTSDIATAWTNRASLTYASPSEVF